MAHTRCARRHDHSSFRRGSGFGRASINFIDVLVHGWDLAKATSQDRRLEPHLTEPSLTLARGIVNDQLRTAGAFGPEVGVAADAPMGDRLVAFLGRTP